MPSSSYWEYEGKSSSEPLHGAAGTCGSLAGLCWAFLEVMHASKAFILHKHSKLTWGFTCFSALAGCYGQDNCGLKVSHVLPA